MLRLLGALFGMFMFLAIMAAGGGIYILHRYGQDLPDYRQLATYEPPVTTRVHAGDGRVIAEYAIEHRVFVPIEAMPRRVIKAFLAAEDKNFYSHPGIDFLRVARAAVTNLARMGENRRPIGASTITQQVAKNFLLSNELSLTRKIKEAILAFRIERAFTKNRILELYLNEIYLGFGSYGIAAAALNYFNKSLDDLTVAEVAFLAVLPKAPNNYHPVRRRKAARARRDWIIGRMLEEQFITEAEAKAAQNEPITLRDRAPTEIFRADYFAEEVRRELVQRYGDKGLYEGGLSVRTTLDPRLQEFAGRVLRDGLVAYDRRHGWRGPLARIELDADWQKQLADLPPPAGLGGWRLALVIELDSETASIGFKDGSVGSLPMAEMKWARSWRENQRVGPSPRKPKDVLAPGDVVAVAAVTVDAKEKPYPPQTYALRQIPNIGGALVALDPHTGRVLAMTGGLSFSGSEFNRATQAWRQPGSAFKPFVYLSALDNGFTPGNRILDAPFVIDQGPGLGKWKPANYTKKFYGLSPMRLGIEKSRNLMTVRLAEQVGMDLVATYAERFGIVEHMPRQLSMALGAGETTLLRLTTAYAMLVNGGRQIIPSLIDRIQDRHGRPVLRHDQRPCEGCQNRQWSADQAVPSIPDDRAQLADPASAYQVVSMLQGVVQRGTGRRVRAVGRPLAGKTGTTNDSFDTWFVGFAPDLAVGVFVGFDEPRTLGPRETGSSVSAPIFRDFMTEALKDQPSIPFRIPENVRLVRVNLKTGVLARPGDRNVILEAFKPGTEPTAHGAVRAGDGGSQTGGQSQSGISGLY